MNNIYVVIVIAFVALIGGALYFSMLPATVETGVMEKDSAMSETGNETMEGENMNDVTDDAMMKEDGAMMEKAPDGAMMSAGSYEAYAPEKLSRAVDGDVILFFRASWCPTCRALDADIRKNLGSIPKGVTILEVDYDSSSALRQKYGVTYQHTFVHVDAGGAPIKKWMGSPTLSALLSNIQ